MSLLIALAIVALPGGMHGDLFVPDGAAKHPAVVLLYGGAGLTRRGSDFRAYGEDLARRGFVVLLPHYFDATGSLTMGPLTSDRFALWQRAVRDSIAWLRRRPGTSSVSLIGFSLGAFLAISLGADSDAIVDYYGGISDLVPLPTKLPPVLILHGDADFTVPVREARRLAALLEERRVPHEMHLYPGEDHVFDARRSPGSAGQDAWTRTVRFLEAHAARPPIQDSQRRPE
jgi:carboxymethylenebutenolidase